MSNKELKPVGTIKNANTQPKKIVSKKGSPKMNPKPVTRPSRQAGKSHR